MQRLVFSFIPFLLGVQVFPTARLKPEAAVAFDRYAAKAEAKMKTEPVKQRGLRGGGLKIESVVADEDRKAPGAMIQDWTGRMFIPGATLAEAESMMQDYAKYKNYYKPKIIDSKELGRRGGEFDVLLRMYEKHVFAVVLNAEYHIEYAMPNARELTIASRSTRIAEVKDPDKSYASELPVGNDSGFLWRLNSYWRFEQVDGGVYARCEAISLSRDVPLGFGWLMKGFLDSFPKESMMNTLRGTRAAIEARKAITAEIGSGGK